MKKNLTTAEKRWNECAEDEATYEIAFSPGALREARLIAELERVKWNRSRRRHLSRNAAVPRRGKP